ncbi:MAG: FHA domain-containing protein [Polyangiaceae bacterium]|nr:FHA domain-containing protein [Polyangiaceae bacterium]
MPSARSSNLPAPPSTRPSSPGSPPSSSRLAPSSARAPVDPLALRALQNDLQRFEQTQRSQERALWLLYIEGPGVAPFCERLLRRRLVIGRDAGCSLPLLGETMAPQHALLEHDDESDHWVVVPVANDRPTFVNGKRVHARTPLGPEDRVQVGPWLLRIGVEGDDDWHQKLRFATLHSQPEVPGLAKGASAKPDRLIVLSGPVPSKEIRLDEGPVRLGPVKGSSLVPERGALADLNVEVSPLPDGSYELVCHGDGGTVSVNGVVERRVVLTPGDRLRLGGGTGAAYLVFAGRGGEPPMSKKADAGAPQRVLEGRECRQPAPGRSDGVRLAVGARRRSGVVAAGDGARGRGAVDASARAADPERGARQQRSVARGGRRLGAQAHALVGVVEPGRAPSSTRFDADGDAPHRHDGAARPVRAGRDVAGAGAQTRGRDLGRRRLIDGVVCAERERRAEAAHAAHVDARRRREGG